MGGCLKMVLVAALDVERLKVSGLDLPSAGEEVLAPKGMYRREGSSALPAMSVINFSRLL